MTRFTTEFRDSERFAGLKEGLSNFRSYFICLLVILGGGCFIAYSYRHDIACQLGAFTVNEINRCLQPADWRLSIGDAELVSSNEVKVSQIQLFSPSQKSPAVTVDTLLVRLSSPWENFSGKMPKVEQIRLDRGNITMDLSSVKTEEVRQLWTILNSNHNLTTPGPEFIVLDAKCEIKGSGETGDRGLLLRAVHLQSTDSINKTGTLSNRVLFRCESDYFETAIIEFINEATVWNCEAKIEKIVLDDSALGLLPEFPGFDIRRLNHLSGIASVNLTADSRIANELPTFRLHGDIQKLHLVHDQIPTSISDGNLDFAISNDRVEITNAKAKLGDGELRLQYWQNGLFETRENDLSGRFINVQVSPRISPILPPMAKKFFDDFSPDGLVSFQFQVKNDGEKVSRSVNASIHDLSASFHRFPYRLEHFVGTVYLEDDICKIDVQSLEATEVVSIKGSVVNPGPEAKFDIRFSCPGELPINEKLFEAIKNFPNVYKQLQAIKPRGVFAIDGQFVRTDPKQAPLLTYAIDLKQCSLRHDFFDYPFRNVNGRVSVKGSDISFEQVSGENLSTAVICNGGWSLGKGLNLRFLAKNIGIDEQLRMAMIPVVKDAWDALRPEGQIPHATVDLRWTPNMPSGPEVDVILDARRQKNAPENNLTINPVAFPYETQNIEGLFEVRGKQIEFSDVHARHGRTWMACAGNGTFSNRGWTVHLTDILTGSLPIDEDFIGAFPASLRSSLEALNFNGNVNVSGKITLGGKVIEALVDSGQASPEVATASFVESHRQNTMQSSMNWDLRFDVDRGEMEAGVPLKNLHGMVHLVGAYDGTSAFSEGDILFDSMSVLNAQVTNVSGPIWIDAAHVGVGLFASPSGSKANSNSISGEVFGGQIQFDGQTWFDDKQKFYFHTTVANAGLKSAAKSFAPSLQSIDGFGQFALRLSGDCDTLDSVQGEGMMKMYEARIYELPVLLATLKQLRSFNEDKSAFDTGNIDFIVKGKNVAINRMELLGDPISLIGNGRVDFDRNVDLNFYTIAGRNRFHIPILSDLYKAGSQQVLWITVNGTLENPRTERQLLPGVNESLKELFQLPEQ